MCAVAMVSWRTSGTCGGGAEYGVNRQDATHGIGYRHGSQGRACHRPNRTMQLDVGLEPSARELTEEGSRRRVLGRLEEGDHVDATDCPVDSFLVRTVCVST